MCISNENPNIIQVFEMSFCKKKEWNGDLKNQMEVL